MPPETTTDPNRDPILDGRDGLRLVKLRLAITLVAVALLPIAAVSPLARVVVDEASTAHHERLVADAGQASRAIGREIDAVGSAATSLLDDPLILGALSATASDSDQVAASNRLASLVVRQTGSVAGAALMVDGTIRATSGAAVDLAVVPEPSALAGGPGNGAGPIVLPSSAGAETLQIVTSTVIRQGKASSVEAIVVRLAPDGLLATIPADAGLSDRTIRLADQDGTVVASLAGSFDLSALPGAVLALTTDASTSSSSQAALQVAGLAGWSVAMSAPIPFGELPTEALLALALVIVLLIAFTLWMAGRIVRPAAQLEASRSRMRELYESAREAALRDSLTGLGNHRAFQEAVARMVETSRRYATQFALVLIDIDEFKQINDTRGHAVGDQLLAEVGSLIRSTIRLSDSGFRVGGDEFAILLPHTDADGAVVMTRRLLARGLDQRSGGEYRGPISFSAGVTGCPEYGQTRVELTAQADAALYRGKRGGRTLVTVFDPAIDRGHVDEGMRAELSSAISTVIESGWLSPVYQPIVNLTSGYVSGFEGLVRVPPESTFAHAGALFDAAEAAGRVADLDRAALEVVLLGARDLDDSLSLSLNVSPRTLETPEFTAGVFLATLSRHGVRPERVILELTERESVRDAERLGAAIRTLQEVGVRVAADDVGAGNAGLRLLSQFPFDVVKIDLSLVQGAGGHDQTLSVLASLVEMADRLGAHTIAEGVETAAQLRTIRRLGITAGQGYLLGRPSRERQVLWIDLDALAEDAAGPEPWEREAAADDDEVEPASHAGPAASTEPGQPAFRR
jgi:diguanylate cyclase (GGDEF)-like protein